MPMPMSRPEPLIGADPTGRARLLDDADVEVLIAQAERDENEDEEEEEDEIGEDAT